MPSCSVHHCVLVLLTLTFTTEPTLGFMSVMVKLNQPAVLPCKMNCLVSLKWTVIDKPGRVLALCNQTSCWSEEGFIISYAQYLKGDLSLTVTAADYSNRGLYTCACGHQHIINTVHLSIETLMLSVQLKPGEDLRLNVHIPDQIEVVYKNKGSHDPYGEQICSVTLHSLQCKAEYKTRASLSGTELILKNVKPPDSGVYTVRDEKHKDIILIYTLSMKETLVVHVKRHESVTLPCMWNCSGLVKWILSEKTVAWCNKRVCKPNEGYEMSHDRYLIGDFSLTITEADFSERGLYECKCDDKVVNVKDVVIETENLSVQLNPGEDLLMDLPTPERVEVIYDDCVIYPNDPKIKQLCKSEHTHRLSHVLKLGKVQLTDRGVYIIRDKEFKEQLLKYSVDMKVSALASTSTSVTVKLNQTATLPCSYRCSGVVKWTMFHKPSDILSQCDQTSCWSEQGYEMSHGQYLKGKLYLTITAADYSKRALYTCECNDVEACGVRLIIETLTSSVELNPGEALVMGLPVADPVEVIYTARNLAASYGQQICTVTEHTLQCKAEYTLRASLSSTNITLRDVNVSDSGSYTVRDRKHDEVIHIYTLLVKVVLPEPEGKPEHQVVAVVVPVLLLVLVIMGTVLLVKHLHVKRLKQEKAELEETIKLNESVMEVDTSRQRSNSDARAVMKQMLEVDKFILQYRTESVRTSQSWTSLNDIPVVELLKRRRTEMDEFVQSRRISEQDTIGQWWSLKRPELETIIERWRTYDAEPDELTRPRHCSTPQGT
ncbi:uncharacterized protein DAT39_021442 [Clarias magur]|uniref:Ig-like domain-containing protein n=1 Tax=Clarias magur TaxID=1594786 RepID=A0A8J4X8Y0_CLAMG|nr:uncharacterized protein DAT39_021442 [Clarias magur]